MQPGSSNQQLAIGRRHGIGQGRCLRDHSRGMAPSLGTPRRAVRASSLATSTDSTVILQPEVLVAPSGVNCMLPNSSTIRCRTRQLYVATDVNSLLPTSHMSCLTFNGIDTPSACLSSSYSEPNVLAVSSKHPRI